MKIFYRTTAALLALLAASAVIASCGEKNPPAETTDSAVTTEPAITEPADGKVAFGDLRFTLAGGAKIENGILSGDRSASTNTALCEDIGTLEGCLDIKVKLTGSTSGGISFKYKNDERRIFIGFDKRTNNVRISNYTKDGVSIVKSLYCPMENDAEITVRIAFRNSIARFFINDISDTAIPLAEITVSSSSGKGLMLDCGSGSLQFLSLSLSDYTYATEEGKTYVNPVAPGADPFILPWEGKYYLYSTNAGSTGFKVYESDDLSKWTDKGYCLKKGEPNSPVGDRNFWAPEVYYIDGHFYMFYVTNENIGVAISDSPLGPFTKYSSDVLFKNTKAIDPHLFIDDDGQMYLYYVKFGGGNHIYGAKFDLKTCRVTNEKRLISAEAGWETIMGSIAEGPFMLKRNGVYYLTYSANHYESQGYAVGCATSSTPLGNYEKCEYNPILSKNETIKAVGTGHHSFFTAENGELFIVYHRHNSLTEIQTRQTCIDRCGFVKDPDGTERLVVYGPTSTQQRLPE